MLDYAEQKKKRASASILQKKNHREKPVSSNLTGIPDRMKIHFENLSGFSFDDVRVHYNSDKPAQLQALAYTLGNQVYVAPGQEKHLGHELGHVVQQKQGRVQGTVNIGGLAVNDDDRLEKEADIFKTSQIVQMRHKTVETPLNEYKPYNPVVQKADDDFDFFGGYGDGPVKEDPDLVEEKKGSDYPDSVTFSLAVIRSGEDSGQAHSELNVLISNDEDDCIRISRNNSSDTFQRHAKVSVSVGHYPSIYKSKDFATPKKEADIYAAFKAARGIMPKYFHANCLEFANEVYDNL